MENHPFKAPHQPTDSTAFNAPTGRLAEHLQEFANVAHGARERMDQSMQKITGLTDQAALRAAEAQGGTK